MAQNEKTIKRWIEIPEWLADAIAELAERDHRTEKGETEYLLENHPELMKEKPGAKAK